MGEWASLCWVCAKKTLDLQNGHRITRNVLDCRTVFKHKQNHIQNGRNVPLMYIHICYYDLVCVFIFFINCNLVCICTHVNRYIRTCMAFMNSGDFGGYKPVYKKHYATV